MAKIKVADYLIKRLRTLGITEVFGLPGDYNFNIVEAVENNKEVNWIGSTNELNAGYAADGYSRVKGYGAIVTTYGVGELSAINAIAGCMAENLPVAKIVGVPSTKHIKNKTLLHHNLDNSNYYAFYNAYKSVTEACAFLTFENAKEEIDRLINVMVNTKKPVYIAIPMDVCDLEVEDDFKLIEEKSDTKTLNIVVEEILKNIEASKNPIIIADVLTKRFDAKESLNDLISKTSIPSTCLIRGTDVIKHSQKNFLGTYCGSKDNIIAYQTLHSSDCIMLLGTVLSDLNTMGFDYDLASKNIIEIQPKFTVIKDKKYENILIKDVVKLLSEKINYKFEKELKRALIYDKHIKQKGSLKLDYVYNGLNEFIKENDIYISEVGLTPLGTIPIKMPDKIDVFNQILWGSIGWGTPCALGSAIADRTRRTILITGDGAHQLTAQEISTMMRNNVKPIIFVINNNGYTVERILCDDVEYEYNNIACWNYSKLPSVFKGECFCAQVKTKEEFDEALEKINKIDKMCYIELICDYMDIPKLAKLMAKHPDKL